MTTADDKPVDIWASIFSPKMLTCVFTGLASGFPLFVLIQLVPAWLRTEGADLATIGLFSLILLPYNWKFVWAPLMDQYLPPLLGRRTGWMLITQIALLLAISALGWLQPENSVTLIASVCVIVAFFSASQDIVIDAYRRELLSDNELGLGNSIHVQAYRISGLVPVTLGLTLADHFKWDLVFLVIGSFMLVGIAATFFFKEAQFVRKPRSLRQAVVEPFTEFVGRNQWGGTVSIILLMVLYKLGDNMAVALQTPFFIDMGYSLTAIGQVAKIAGTSGAIVGGLLGGVSMLKLGINRALWIFGVVQIVTIFGFALLSEIEVNDRALGAVMFAEYVGVGLGTAALVAFIAKSTAREFAASQLALLTAISSLPRTFASASSGVIIEVIGYTSFFYVCMALAVPGLLLLIKVAPWGQATGSDVAD